MNIDFTRIVDNRVDKCSSRKGGNSRLNNLTVNLEFRACESVSNLLQLCGEGRVSVGSVPGGSVG